MSSIIENVTRGEGSTKDLELLKELAEVVKDTSLCGLGQTAANPVLSTLKHFGEEYREHVEQKRCRAGVCKALLRYEIDPETCTGCARCAKECSAGAITGEKKLPHVIDVGVCEKCGICYEVCESGAVLRK